MNVHGLTLVRPETDPEISRSQKAAAVAEGPAEAVAARRLRGKSAAHLCLFAHSPPRGGCRLQGRHAYYRRTLCGSVVRVHDPRPATYALIASGSASRPTTLSLTCVLAHARELIFVLSRRVVVPEHGLIPPGSLALAFV